MWALLEALETLREFHFAGGVVLWTIGLNTVLIPLENQRDISDIPQTVQDHVKLIPVSEMKQVFDLAFAQAQP